VEKATHIGGCPTGHWLDQMSDAKAIAAADMYIIGVFDGLLAGDFEHYKKIYPDIIDSHKNKIAGAVREYYQKIPENKFRQIAAVIRSNCRDFTGHIQ
jgi:ribosomal protein S17E